MTQGLAEGTELSHYRIVSKVGAGGMGEVYLAEDTKLDRKIALKLLRSEFVTTEDRLRRFVQEAKAAAALNHPNIAHIYEVGETDGTHYIAMEFIDGETLRHRISRGELKLTEALEFASQIAAALSSAHAAGVTHRDIKPDNVMVRPDGYAKVLDFGLAKLTEPSTETQTEAPTKVMVNTDPGTVLGTVGYMSPEQARGQSVDARTDIWSLGVVIYQMVSHRLPFEGSSNSDVISAILEKEPQPLARYARDVPEALEWIVTKALTKERDERYQTAKELMVDLRRIKQRLEATEIERSSFDEPANLMAGASLTPSANSRASAQTLQTPADERTTDSVSSAEYIVSEIKRHKLGASVIAALVVLGIIAGGMLISKLSTSDKARTPPAIQFSRLTSGGKIGSENISGAAAISPDGKYVVFWTTEQEKASCYVRQISTNSQVKIVGSTSLDVGGSTFSPDGEFIYFDARDNKTTDRALFKVPVLGGTPIKVLEGIWGPNCFSPDGKQIAYVRLLPSTGESWLIVANADGSGTPRTISKRVLPDYYSKQGPSWSPDGQRIAVGAETIPEVGNATVVEVQVNGGSEHEITARQWSEIFRVLWTRDGSGLVVSANALLASTGAQLYYISYPDGATHRITNDLNGYGQLSLALTADSKTIVTVQYDSTKTIWLTPPTQDSSRAHQISNGKYEGAISLDSSPDGSIIYVDYSGNGMEIWSMKGDGTEKKQLTSDGAIKTSASVSRDGRYILFSSNRSGDFNIWRMDLDGNNQRQLTNNEKFAGNPVGSNDGKWVVYHSLREGKWTLWKIPIDGGDGTRMIDKQCVFPAISPDGKFVASMSPDETESLKWQIAILPFEGGEVIKLLKTPLTTLHDCRPTWSPDGRSILYIDRPGTVGNIYSQPIDGGPSRAITGFKSDGIAAFSWTRDGKQLIIGRGPESDDVVTIKDFR